MQNKAALDAIQIALCVHRCGSFRQAATELGTSHSTVSRRITELEEAVGADLFDRRGHHVRATETALRLFKDVEIHVLGIESAIEAISRPSGTRWVTLASNAYHIVPALTSSLAQVTGSEYQVIPAHPVEADIGMVCDGQLRSIDAFHFPIGAVSWGIYAHRTLRYDICKQPLFNTRESPPIDQLALAEFDQCLTLETLEMVINAVETGAGLGLLPRQYAQHGFNLVEVHGEQEQWISHFGLSCGHNAEIRNLTQRIAEHLKATLEPMPTNVYSMRRPRKALPHQHPTRDLARPDRRDSAQ